MTIIIFFGGVLFGFLIGVTSMALISAINYRTQCEELREVLVSRPLVPPRDPGRARERSIY
jgi:hypothetical protein